MERIYIVRTTSGQFKGFLWQAFTNELSARNFRTIKQEEEEHKRPYQRTGYDITEIDLSREVA